MKPLEIWGGHGGCGFELKSRVRAWQVSVSGIAGPVELLYLQRDKNSAHVTNHLNRFSSLCTLLLTLCGAQNSQQQGQKVRTKQAPYER